LQKWRLKNPGKGRHYPQQAVIFGAAVSISASGENAGSLKAPAIGKNAHALLYICLNSISAWHRGRFPWMIYRQQRQPFSVHFQTKKYLPSMAEWVPAKPRLYTRFAMHYK
jgi:hypothetical protein